MATVPSTATTTVPLLLVFHPSVAEEATQLWPWPCCGNPNSECGRCPMSPDDGCLGNNISQFGHFLSDPEFLALSNTPDRPYSLYEGWAGAACFLQDLLRPSDARFPFFELP